MIQELLYTSAPKGLKPGSRGFCTVLSTSGMAAPVATALESLSGYRPVFPPGNPQADRNPIVYSHIQMSLSGRRSHVLSRIADYGLDYSQRTNKLAHHLVLDSGERAPAGPAWMLAHSGMMRDSWNGELRVVSGERQVPQGKVSLQICSAWKELTGDAGWAGVLAESFLKHPEQPAYIIFSPGMNLLALMEEAIALLPVNRRWDVTFSTYFTKVPNGVTCNWRCLLADSPEAKESRRYVQSLRIDLTKPLPSAKGGALVEASRTGKMPAHTDPDQAESSSSQMPPRPQSPDDSDRTIRIVQDRAAPPSIRGQAGAPPIRQMRSQSWGFLKWGIVIVLLIGIIAGAGIYASKLKSPPPLQIADRQVEQKPQLAEMRTTASEQSALMVPVEKTSEPQEMVSPLSGEQNPASPVAPNSLSDADNANDLSKQKKQLSNSKMQADDRSSIAATETVKPSVAEAVSAKEVPQRPRNYIYFWGDLEKGLENGASKEFLLKDVQIEDATVWCPTDGSNVVRATKRTVEQDFRKAGWEVYLVIAAESDNESRRIIKTTAKAQIRYKDLCRFVYSINVKDLNEPLTVLPYGQVRRNVMSKEKYCRHNFSFPTIFPQTPKEWKLRLESLQFSTLQNDVLTPQQVEFIPLNWEGNTASGQIAFKVGDLIEGEILSGNEANSKQLKDELVSVNVSVAKAQEDMNQQSGTEVNADIAIGEFQKKMKDYVMADINKAINTSVANTKLSVKWLNESNLITGRELLNEIDRLIQSAESIKKNNTVPKKQDDKYSEDEIKKRALADAADNQLGRLDRIKEFCEFANDLTSELRSLQLHKLQISQECQSGNDKKYLPIFVYLADEQSSTTATK